MLFQIGRSHHREVDVSGALTVEAALRRTCIFVGAGSSKALADVPIQSELVDDLLRWHKEVRPRPHLSRSLIGLLDSIKDIELVLSHYHNLGYQSGRHGPYRYELMLLRVALAAYLSDATRRCPDFKRTSAVELVATYMRNCGLDRSSLVVITTNYDLVLEGILDAVFGKGSYWYPGVSQPEREGAVPILKLHGSINWMEDRGSAGEKTTTRTTKPFEVLDPSMMELLQNPRSKSGYFFKLQSQKYVPVIVPFMFQKTTWLKDNNEQWRSAFDGVWNNARKQLLQADTLVTWGYSLPAADYHLFALLFDALAKSHMRLEIVDPSPDTRMIRLGKYFHDRTNVCSTDLCTYLSQH